MTKEPVHPKSGIHAARRVAKNSFYLVTSKVFEIASTLIITSITARYLGVDLFGYLAIAMAIGMTVIPIADFGIERIICREIAKHNDSSSMYVSTTLSLRAALSALIMAVTYGLLQAFSTWPHMVNQAILVAVASELIWSMGMTYFSVVKAFEQMQYELFVNIVFKAAALLFVWMVVLNDWGFMGVFYARLASSLLFLALAAVLLYGKFVTMQFTFDFRLAKFMLRESYPLAIASLALALIFKVDVFLLQWLGTPSDVSFFEAPNRLVMQLQMLPVAFSLSLFPVLSRTAGDGVDSPLSRYYGHAFKLLLIISVPLAVFLFIGSKPLITVIFGPAFHQASVSLDILAPTVVFLFLVSLQNLFLTAVGKQILNTITTVAALVLNIALDILLIPHYGFIGASIGTLVAYFFMMAMNAYFVRKYGVKTGSAFLVAKTVCAALFMSLTVFINTGHYFLTLVTRYAVAGVIYIVVMLALKAVSREDIALIREIMARRRGPRPEPAAAGAQGRGPTGL